MFVDLLRWSCWLCGASGGSTKFLVVQWWCIYHWLDVDFGVYGGGGDDAWFEEVMVEVVGVGIGW